MKLDFAFANNDAIWKSFGLMRKFIFPTMNFTAPIQQLVPEQVHRSLSLQSEPFREQL